MSYPTTHPAWMWLYFGGLASVGLALFTVIMWDLTTLSSRVSGRMKSAVRRAMFGAVFLLFALWFPCGIGGPPGNLLSTDPSVHSQEFAMNAALGGMFFSVPALACLLVALRKARAALSQQS